MAVRYYWVCLIFSSLSVSIAFKWIPSFPGKAIPSNAIYLRNAPSLSAKIVGRARHFEEVQPAEVVAGKYAQIKSCTKVYPKYFYDILVRETDESCEWRYFDGFPNFPIDVVRGGTTPDGEPIFIGKSGLTDQTIAAIQFSNKKISVFDDTLGVYNTNYLSCQQNITWLDSPAKNLPEHAIFGPLVNLGQKQYVGRIKSGCSVIPGQVLPDLGEATAVLENGTVVKSNYTQFLVGDAKDYIWVRSRNGEIPDYAVVSGQASTGELMYVANKNNTIGYVLQSKAAREPGTFYDILVKN